MPYRTPTPSPRIRFEKLIIFILTLTLTLTITLRPPLTLVRTHTCPFILILILTPTIQVTFTTFSDNMVSATDSTPAFGGALCLSPGLLHEFDPSTPGGGSAKLSITKFYNNYAIVEDFQDTEGVTAGGAVLVAHFASKDGVQFDTVHFHGNRAYYGGDGGAVAVWGMATAVTFIRSTFKKNEAWSRVADSSTGGALFLRRARVWVTDSWFSNNYAGTDDASNHPEAFPGMGGALVSIGGLVQCHTCHFSHNTASNTASDQWAKGGAVYLGPIEEKSLLGRARSFRPSPPPPPPPPPSYLRHVFTNCSFSHNSVTTKEFGWGEGGAVSTYMVSPVMIGCRFINNTAMTSSQTPARGGAISLDTMYEGSEGPLIQQCTFESNMVSLFLSICVCISFSICMYIKLLHVATETRIPFLD